MEIISHACVAAFVSCLLLFLLLVYNLESVEWANLSPNDIVAFGEHLSQADSTISTVGSEPGFTLSIPIDHFNTSDKRTFQNRYWLNNTFYEPGGPVFLFDTGEHGVSDAMATMFLGEAMGNSALMVLARRYHGLAILWEHRFYGGSLPFPLDNETGLAVSGYDAYKYLTNEQALEDAAYLAWNFRPPNLESYWTALSPDNTAWTFIGGSYPGVRAAMARVRNPETWFAAWASSAPVQAQVDMSVYFRPIEQAMTRNCSADVHAAIEYIDGIFQNGSEDEAEPVRQAIYMTGLANPGLQNSDSYPSSATNMTLFDIAQVLNYPFQHTANKYQIRGFTASLLPFCNKLERYNHSASDLFPLGEAAADLNTFKSWLEMRHHHAPTAAGVATTHNASIVFHALLSAIYWKMLDDDKDQLDALPISNSIGDSVSWSWQYCREFGFLQVANTSDPINLISRFDNVSSKETNACLSLFPYAPVTPDTAAINDRYGGWRMNPSNVMFTNGEMDPWRTLGVHADRNINPNAFVRNRTKTIPRCNKPPANNEIFGQVYPGQVHIPDLVSSLHLDVDGQPSPFEAGVDLFTSALDSWFPCFHSSFSDPL